MKLTQSTEHQLRFELNRQERLMFEKTLQLYPLIPEGHHRITNSPDDHLQESQHLLQEALREGRQRKSAAIQEFLSAPNRFRSRGEKMELVIERDAVDLLLQVLNDVRVGAWIALGSPDDIHFQSKDLDAGNVTFIVALELAGEFEMILLEASNHGGDQSAK